MNVLAPGSRKTTWLLAAASVTGLCACSAPASSAEARITTSPATATSTTTTAAPSPTNDEAETRRTASFIAQHRTEINESIDDMQKCPSVDDAQMILCSITFDLATLRGQGLAHDMRAVTEPPIGETAPLWSDTLAAADALGDVDTSKCSADAEKGSYSTGNCATDMHNVRRATERLGSVLDGWRPYGG